MCRAGDHIKFWLAQFDGTVCVCVRPPPQLAAGRKFPVALALLTTSVSTLAVAVH